MTPNNQTTQGDLSADPIGFSLHVQTPGHNGISTDHMEISIPGANITHTPYSSIVESVIDGHFFINRDKALLKRDILETITDVVILL